MIPTGGDLVIGFAAALTIGVLTAPVGISGAVFLLPVQLSVLHVPNPAVTPTNLLYNVVAAPGALLRYRRQGQLGGELAPRLVIGAVPGVIIGAGLRVFVFADPRTFRLLAAAVLLPLGSWLLWRAASGGRPADTARRLSTSAVVTLAFAAGCIGGIYGIGGGSLVAPVLVGTGMSLAVVAPAALTSTCLTSVVGAVTFGVLSLTNDGAIAPNWTLGLACGVGGLIGGYAGARLQPRLPERGLRILLGVIAVALAVTYLVQSR